MNDTTVGDMTHRVAELMEARLRIRGAGLGEKLRRGGRLLPRKVRREAEYLLRASELERVPKLRSQLDPSRIASAYDTCIAYLKPLGQAAHRRALLLDILETVGAAVFVTLVVVILLLIWRGLI